MKLLKSILVVLFLLITVNAYALTLAWDLPTKYIDGTNISTADQAQIITYLFWRPNTTTSWAQFATITSGVKTWAGTAPVGPGVPADYTATAELRAVKSGYSNIVSWTIPYPTPNAPVLNSVTGGVTGQ
jgi:hypothetical protein